jgi:hypothetical protein
MAGAQVAVGVEHRCGRCVDRCRLRAGDLAAASAYREPLAVPLFGEP